MLHAEGPSLSVPTCVGSWSAFARFLSSSAVSLDFLWRGGARGSERVRCTRERASERTPTCFCGLIGCIGLRDAAGAAPWRFQSEKESQAGGGALGHTRCPSSALHAARSPTPSGTVA